MKNKDAYRLYMIFLLRHSTKLHIFGARRSTVAVICGRFSLFFRRVRLVPLRESGLALAAHEEEEVDHGFLRPRAARCTARGVGCSASALLVVRRRRRARWMLALGYWQCVRVAKTICAHRALAGGQEARSAKTSFGKHAQKTLAEARRKTCFAGHGAGPVRGEGALGEDGCSSAARLVLVARAAGRYASHGLGRQSPSVAPRISPPRTASRSPSSRVHAPVLRTCRADASRVSADNALPTVAACDAGFASGTPARARA